MELNHRIVYIKEHMDCYASESDQYGGKNFSYY